MIDWGFGSVVAIRQSTGDLQRIDVRDDATGEVIPAIVYPKMVGACAVGMRVFLNQTARNLRLGTGGFDFAIPEPLSSLPVVYDTFYVQKGTEKEILKDNHTNVKEISGDYGDRENGHIMKMRYTPLQIKVHAIEEDTHPLHHMIQNQESLQNCPVIIAELHSMLPVICSVLQYRLQNSCKIVYVMTDGGALPAMMSSNIRELKQKQMIAGVVTLGHAFGGDIEAINIYSGLLAAKHALQADVIVVAMGPGVAGTGSKYGHTGIEQGIVLNAVRTLDGIGIPVLRCSQADQRKRHHGMSHHTITALMQVSLVSGSIGIPEIIPLNVKEKIWNQLIQNGMSDRYEIILTGRSIVQEAMAAYGLACYSMGRKYTDDPVFFDMAGAAAEVALRSDIFKKSCKYVAEFPN